MGEFLTRTLSRSLDPLPDESLAGFLLRSAWRLRITLQQLARFIRCGNRATGQLSRRLLIDLNIPVFAAATALTATEAVELTLLPWAHRYPPIGQAVGSIRADRNTRFDEWLFHEDVRYCPVCLAGDGTAIQQSYGGSWKRIWHLPIAFACPDHNAFLRDTCPRQHPLAAAPHLLIAPASEWVLHPAQCRRPTDPASRSRRRPCCGARLNQTLPPDPEPRSDVLNTQRRLASLLDPRTSADDAARIFTDLRVTVSLLYVAWRYWELCVLLGVRDGLRSGDVFVPGSRRYADPSSYLFTEQAWEQRREEFCALVGKPADGRVGLEQGLDELHTALGDLEQVLASTGPDQVGSVRLDEQGNLVIPPLSAEDVPAEATAVKRSWPGCCRSRRSPPGEPTGRTWSVVTGHSLKGAKKEIQGGPAAVRAPGCPRGRPPARARLRRPAHGRRTGRGRRRLRTGPSSIPAERAGAGHGLTLSVTVVSATETVRVAGG